MRLTFIQLAAFVARWKAERLTDEDLQALEGLLAANPNAGPVMAGTGGLRKVRFAPPSRHGGKSGGYRVCYVLFADHGRVYLLTMYPKSEKANLTAAERNVVRTLIRRLTESLRDEPTAQPPENPS